METSQQALSWATFAVLSYAWLGTVKLDGRPAWEPMVCLMINALPGGMITDIVKTTVVAVVERLPWRGGAKP